MRKINKRFFAFLLVFVVIIQLRFVYFPARNKLNSLDKLLDTKESEFAELQKLCIEYKEQQKREKEETSQIAKEKFSLFSYVGNLLTKHGIERNVSGIQPLPISEKEGFRIERVKLSLRDVQLKQLYNLLYEIEVSKNAIRIQDFRMRKEKENSYLLDAEIELVVVKTTNQNPSL